MLKKGMKMYKDLDGMFGAIQSEAVERASKYIVLTGNEAVDYNSIVQLQLLKSVVDSGISNDVSKYNMVESYKTSLAWTINARSLQNFLSLRSDKAALWEIRELARAVFYALPEDHKYLFEEHMKGQQHEQCN